MIPKKPVPDPGSSPGQAAIRDGYRFSDKIMLQQ